MFFKAVGCILIVGASSLIGFIYSIRGAQRAEQLLEMKKALIMLRNEIRFRLTPFGEAALSICEMVDQPVSNIFKYSGESAIAKNGVCAYEIWDRAISKCCRGSLYTKDDTDAFKAMGKSLGYLDKEMQEDSINMLIEYIDGEIAIIKENDGSQSKMYKSLGVLGGLLIAVVLL